MSFNFSGIGRCGNGTLDLGSLGTATKVTGMTYLDEQQMWIFSGSFVSILINTFSGACGLKQCDHFIAAQLDGHTTIPQNTYCL